MLSFQCVINVFKLLMRYFTFFLPYSAFKIQWIFYIYSMSLLEKAMAPHSSTLAWKIPGTAEPGGLPSMGSHGVGHD